MTTTTATIDEFLHLLTLRREADAFVTEPGGASPGGSMYGGMLAAQLLMVGAALTDLPLPQSLQLLFLRPGDASAPMTYRAQVLRDGRSIATFRITGTQDAGPVVDGTVSFTLSRTGIEHQIPRMPAAPNRETMVPYWHVMNGYTAPHPSTSHHPLEQRGGQPLPSHANGDAPVFQWWCRPHATLPDDPRVHAAALVHVSDFMAGPLAKYYDRLGKQASLDHSVWFHGEPRCAGWQLLQVESPRASQGRALLEGRVYQGDGTLSMTVVQEALVRA